MVSFRLDRSHARPCAPSWLLSGEPAKLGGDGGLALDCDKQPTTAPTALKFRGLSARERCDLAVRNCEAIMAKIFIDGESGTTGLQIREKLEGVRGVELASLPAEARRDSAAKQKLYGGVDVVILCLPDEAAKEAALLVDAMGETAPRVDRRLVRPSGRAGLDLRLSGARRGAGRGDRQGEEGRQSRLPRDGRDRASAPADRRGGFARGHGRCRSARSAAIPAAARR